MENEIELKNLIDTAINKYHYFSHLIDTELICNEVMYETLNKMNSNYILSKLYFKIVHNKIIDELRKNNTYNKTISKYRDELLEELNSGPTYRSDEDFFINNYDREHLRLKLKIIIKNKCKKFSCNEDVDFFLGLNSKYMHKEYGWKGYWVFKRIKEYQNGKRKKNNITV